MTTMETNTSKVGEYTIDRPKYENVQQPCIGSIIIQLRKVYCDFIREATRGNNEYGGSQRSGHRPLHQPVQRNDKHHDTHHGEDHGVRGQRRYLPEYLTAAFLQEPFTPHGLSQ